MNRAMKFSWKALILAPLPIPLVFSALFEISTPGRSPILSFAFLFALGSVLSYGITIFLFLPGLFLLSRLTSLTVRLTALVGAVLGCLVYLPVAWQSYLATGVDSGPPQGTFGDYLHHHGFEWDFWALVLAGLVTALLYGYLVNQRPGETISPRHDVEKERANNPGQRTK
jgi:hypothetical protein